MVHPLGNLASHDGSVQIRLLTLVSVMVNLCDYLKSVWCTTSHIYIPKIRIMADYAVQIEVRSDVEAVLQ